MVALVSSAFVASAALVSSVATGGVAAPGAARVIDRTLACTTGVQGGARVIYLRAQSAYGEGGALEWLAQASVSTAGQPVPSKPGYRPTLAGVTAGWPVDLRTGDRSYVADGRIEQGQVAVRTTGGKPLVYADVTDSGRARLFAARGCS